MFDLRIGIGQVSLRLRYAQTLKDKRKVIQSLVQKLRNLGFSVTETGYRDSPKQGSLGFAYAGRDIGAIDGAMEQVEKILIGDFEVLEFNREVFDYSQDTPEEFSWEPDQE